MLRLMLKALFIIWPFLKTAIFRERTIVEVIKENKHLTAMQVVILLLSITLGITTAELADYKVNYRALQQRLIESSTRCSPESPEDDLEQRKQRLMELLTEGVPT